MSLNDTCALCKKARGQHNAVTKACPWGMKTRVGYVMFSETDRFTPACPESRRTA